MAMADFSNNRHGDTTSKKRKICFASLNMLKEIDLETGWEVLDVLSALLHGGSQTITHCRSHMFLMVLVAVSIRL